MNTSLTAYTHLESLLLFQSLHAYGVGPAVFNRVSDLLKKNPHITNDRRFQIGRLSPDALRNFYLHILKEEIRSERHDVSSDPPTPNGDLKGSRKRKAPSPSLPTTQEAAQHAYLIPKLVTKLYARYRSAITEQIRDEEERYERLQRELQGVERGEWDQQLVERASAKRTASRSPSLPKKSPVLHQPLLPANSSPHNGKRDGFVSGPVQKDTQVQESHVSATTAVSRIQKSDGLPNEQTQLDDDVKPGTNTRQNRSPSSPRVTQAHGGESLDSKPPVSSNVNSIPTASVNSAQDSQTPIERNENSSLNTSPLPHQDQYTPGDRNANSTPGTSSTLLSSNGRAQSELNAKSTSTIVPHDRQDEAEQKAKTTSKKPIRKKKGAPDSQPTPSTPQSLPSSILPQPNQPSDPSSVFHLPQSAGVGYNAPPHHIHRSPYPPQTPHVQGQLPQTISPSIPTAITTGGPQGTYPAVPQATPPLGSPHAFNQTYSPQPHPSGGIPSSSVQPQLVQPFSANGVQYQPSPSVPSQFSPTRQQFAGPQSPTIQTPIQQRNFHPYQGQPPYPQQQSRGYMLSTFQVSPQNPSHGHQQPPIPHYSQVSTPVQRPQPPLPSSSGRAALPQIHQLVTQNRPSFASPQSSRTPHSAILTPRSAKTQWKSTAVDSPIVNRPKVLPIDDLPSAPSEQNQPKIKTPRKSRGKAKAKEKEKDAEKDVETEVEPEAVMGKPAEPTPEVETRQGRSRRKGPTKGTRLNSKASSRAGGSIRERTRSPSILSHTDTVTADTESQAGYQVKSEPGLASDAIDEDSAATPSQPPTRRRANPGSTLKRKRNVREPSIAESEEQPVIDGLQTIIVPRQFAKMSKPIMNEIESHKFSSLFTSAVKPKDAEGYYEIIKRPTDLRSIQKAIQAGSRFVTATATDTPVGSPGGVGGGIVELPISLDNIPPKAIVNSSQLEKELMRMFVNAVMFNAGEEGIVEDARQMFETVQQAVSKWRSIKQSGGRTEVEETPPVQEEEPPTTAKRRKL